jgi:hypothetical protein
MVMQKPRLWKYKSGINKGKLRPSAKKYLSYKLKSYYQEKRETQKREKIIKEQFKDERPTRKTRKRAQVCYNSSYRVSLRAIGFKEQTEQELERTISEFLNSNEALETIPFDTSGYELEEIDEREDANLNENYITIELNIRGSTTYTEY